MRRCSYSYSIFWVSVSRIVKKRMCRKYLGPACWGSTIIVQEFYRRKRSQIVIMPFKYNVPRKKVWIFDLRQPTQIMCPKNFSLRNIFEIITARIHASLLSILVTLYSILVKLYLPLNVQADLIAYINKTLRYTTNSLKLRRSMMFSRAKFKEFSLQIEQIITKFLMLLSNKGQ